MTERIEKLAKAALERPHPHIGKDVIEGLVKKRVNGGASFDEIRRAFADAVILPEGDLVAGNYTSVDFLQRKDYGYSFDMIRAVYDKYRPLYHELHMNGGNHKSADYGAIISEGVVGMLRRIEASREKYAGDSEKQSYLDELEYGANAVIAFAEGTADAVAREAEKCPDEARRAELTRLEAVCRQVPKYPAESFYEAVQSFFFAFALFPDGVGCLDRYLAPYYEKDLAAGKITRDEALELVENLFINIFGVLGTEHTWSGMTHGVLAGYGADGECVHSEVTEIILDASCELPLYRPQFSYRVTKKTTHEQLRFVTEAHCKRPDILLFLNDDVLVPNLLRIGVTYADAVGYSVSGCNELIVTGCSQMGSIQGHFNVARSLVRLLSDKGKLSGIKDFNDFYAAYERELFEDWKIILSMSIERDTASSNDPAIAESLFTRGCIENATPITKGGADYNACTWCLTGIVNVADSLAVIRETVFEKKTRTLAAWSDCLAANWEGYDELHREALGCSHFGNADASVDSLVNRIAESLDKESSKSTPYRGGKYLFGTLTGYEISHVRCGEKTGATPDGRYNGDAFAASVSAFPGTEKQGIGGYLASAASLDGRFLQTSVVVNITLEKSMVDTYEKRDRLSAMLRTYFDMGGCQLQINYLGVDELICAQKNPDSFAHLRVRVTGFSGFFTTFDKGLQDEIINRKVRKC